MPGVPKPFDEEARLEALLGLKTLDTPPEPRLDRITALAAQLAGTPMATLSLIDRDRQWYKSRLGLSVCETSRDEAFCAYTILEAGQMIVPDTWKDPRFATHPSVVDAPHIRAYAGSPLTTGTGQRVGTLCVLDVVPRNFGPQQLGALEALAVIAIRELEWLAGNPGGSRPELDLPGLFDNAPEGIYQTRPDGTFLSANPAMAHLLGYTTVAEMLAGTPDLQVIYVDPERRRELVRRVRAGGVLFGFESEIRRPGGTSIWVSENIRAVLDGDGDVQRYDCAMEDVTARRSAAETFTREHEELERRVQQRTAELAAVNEALRAQIAQREHAETAVRRSEGKFRALLENAQDLISIIDAEGIILYSSPSVSHILGYKRDKIAGVNAFAFIHPDDHGPVTENLARILKEGSAYVRCEVRVRHRDGSWRLLESIGSLAPPDSPVVGVVVNSRDITERKAFETGLANHARLQEATAELGRRALGCVNAQEMFDAAAELIVRALGADLSSVNELVPGEKKLLMRAGVGWPAGAPGTAVMVPWREAIGVHGSEPLIIADLQANEALPLLSPNPAGPHPTSAASVLIPSGDDKPSFGTVCALSFSPREYSHQDVTFLGTVADLLSTVIARERNREALRLVEERYHQIVANTPGMVYQFLLRGDGTMALPFASEGSREVYGVEPAALIANPQMVLGAVHPDDQASLYRSLAQSATLLQAWLWEGRFVLPAGEKWVQAAARPQRLANGDVLWNGIIMDVSERRRAQDALRAAKEEAERASNAKSEFLSRMSHELRTPLNAILGFGQLLELEDLGASRNQSVEYILDAGRRLLELVDEVLDLARIETGRAALTSEPVDLAAVLQSTFALLAPLARQRGVTFLHPPSQSPGVALGDRIRLGQVLLNLATNAVKQSPPGGQVRFACRRVRGGRLRLAVTDRGPGFSQADCSQLFSAFDRLAATSPGGQGLGIGLAISKRLMDAMGGTIGVRSRPGRGATFFIELPASDEAGAPARPGPNEARTVLYLAGSAAAAEVAERCLEQRPSWRLTTALDPAQGVELAARLRPDLILFDADEIGDATILRRLREDPGTRSTPVLVLSASGVFPSSPEDGGAGSAYLRKPFDADTFLRAADEALTIPPLV